MNVDLSNIEVRTGVNEQGVGFCTIVATSVSGDILIGQLSPDEVRKMAMDWLGSAEAAETDAIVFQMLSEMDLPLEGVGMFLTDMRNRRDS